MGLLPLDHVRAAVHGPWELTRVGFWWRAAEAAATDRDWRAATRRCLRIADALEDVELGGPAWQQLLVATLDAAVRSADLDLVEATIAQVLGHALLEPRDVTQLRAIFSLADQLEQLEIGATIGEAVAQRLPASPWGHFAAAHFHELRRRRGEDVRARDLVRRFQRAAQLFDDEALRAHAQLRAAVAEIAYTNAVEAGRAALREVASHDVAPQDAAWLAYGRTFSTFWLDRVRAADWVGDALDDRATFGGVDAVVVALCENLPVELTDLERERLRAVASALDAPELAAVVTEQLDLREQLEPHLATPLASYDGSIELPRAVTDALERADETTHKALAKYAARATSRQLAPLMLVLARAERAHASADLETAAIQYARRAPAPSCNFLPLAHRAFASGMPRAGAALTRRAVEAAEHSPILQPCVARALKWACDAGSDRSLLWWLQTGERLLVE